MRFIWRTIGVLVILMVVVAVVGVVIIVKTWPKPSEDELLQPMHAVAFLPDGRRFATLNNGGPVRIWDAKTGNELKRFKPRSLHPYPYDAGMIAMAVSADGKYLAGSSNRENPHAYGLEIWDIETGSTIRSFVAHSEMVNALAFTPDGGRILSGGQDREIRVWDVATGRELHRLRGHGAAVNTLAVTPDGRFALSGGGDYDGGQLHDPTIRMWDLSTGAQVRVLEGHDGMVGDICISPDGQIAASVSWDASLRIWNLFNGEQLKSWSSPRGKFLAVSFSPDGKTLLTGSRYWSEGAVQLWDVTTGKEVRSFGLKTIAYDVSFSPDGKSLVSAQEITVAAPPPPPFALMYAEELQVGIAVVSDFESGRELLRVGQVQRKSDR